MRGRVFGARLALALGIAALGSLVWGSAGAGAYVYWADSEAGTIGRAANDGTHVEPDFIAGAGTPISLAVTDSSIYWANGGPNHAVGRASISGGSVTPDFLPRNAEVGSVGVDEGHLFWTEASGNLIGRSELDGSEVKANFVPGVSSACGLAFDSGHIYWAVAGLSQGDVGRAGLSGTPVNNEFVTVSPVGILCGVAVTSSSVYWDDNGLGGGTNIGRASLSNPGSPDVSFIGAAHGPCGIAIHESKLYWANSGTATIARANTDGTSVEYEWIHTGEPVKSICGAAVDDLAPSAEPPPGGGGETPDTTPPKVAIKSGPGKKVAQGKAKFAFTSSESDSTFTCKLDKKKAAPCRSPRSYSGLKPGRHTFQVWATDAAGNKSPTPAKRSFRVSAR